MRVYRNRKRRGWRPVIVTVGDADIETLILRKYLDATNRDDLEAIQVATERFVSDAFFEAQSHDAELVTT
jgi:hypothetical protein